MMDISNTPNSQQQIQSIILEAALFALDDHKQEFIEWAALSNDSLAFVEQAHTLLATTADRQMYSEN